MHRTLALEIPASQELLAFATITVDQDGEVHMHINNVDSAPMAMTRTQYARALRILATSAEAEDAYSGPLSGDTA